MGLIKQMWLEEIDAQISAEIAEEWAYLDRVKQLDQNRRFQNKVGRLNMNTDEMEFRYERRGDVYTTKCWYNGNEKTERGNVHEMPEWLSRILAVSRVGNHIKATINPPPDEILWFRTDTKRNLTQFIDLEDPK